MHKLIMLSRVYQQGGNGVMESWSNGVVNRPSQPNTPTLQHSTAASGTASTIDPDNKFLSGFPRRRLSAEEIRDTMLAMGGNLDPTSGGAHPFPPFKEWNYTQ